MKKSAFVPLSACCCLLLALLLALAPAMGPWAAAQTSAPADGLTAPMLAAPLMEGDRGNAVRQVQERLRQLGYDPGPADGVFGPALTAALLAFQQANGLLESGMADQVTCRALFSQEAITAQQAKTSQIAATEDTLFLFAPMAGAMQASEAMAAPRWNDLGGVIVDFNTNEYGSFQENRFLSTATAPLSTFAADVDTASYAQLRAAILAGEPAPKDSVRVEEMLNYFHYEYAQPNSGEPLGVTLQMAACPWNPETRLLLIGLQAREIAKDDRPAQNLVFLLDVSGSMDDPDKLPLVKRAFSLLLEELAPTDTVSLVTYASRDEVVLDGVPAADKVHILEAIHSLTAGGMTAGAAGIQTAYALAEKHFLPGGSNRILLATDGDLNVGVSDEGSLARLAAEKKKTGVALSVLGFGDGNYKDNKLEALADCGDGNYHYIDTLHEARRALVTELGATFLTVAKDVKLQLDFNPARVEGYRLIGYENRLMAAEDFANDQKDGGELGSGHRVTVLYELVPTGSGFAFGQAESRYQAGAAAPADSAAGEWLTLSIRAKEPQGEESKLYEYPLTDAAFTDAPGDNLRFAAAVAETAMLLRNSEWKGTATYESALALLRGCESVTGDPLKEEFLYLVTLLQREESTAPQRAE